MSENLDLVRSIYAAWERGEFGSAEWADPNIEFSYAGGPEPAAWTGVQDMAANWREWLRGWMDFRTVPIEYKIIDSERILVLVHNTGRGRASGIELDERSVGNLFAIRDGKVTRLVIYLEMEHALTDLGLAE
jgi:ketosteroid isomerase-like protein